MLLRHKDKEKLCAIFSSVNHPFEIWAYGSRVSGKAHTGSDLDLVIRSNQGTKIPEEILKMLQQKIEDSTIPILVELRDWNRLPEYFHKNILENHVVLFSNITKTETANYASPLPSP
ncbi:MAG: nucleotidyltransferase domain-containing protein [Chitinophagaceae bacterium]|jgi:predicted nucleotidyltransferase|nr:nucleotidyltransferase domain-containing protein [Chitinophagaceae bacterium]